ncbi:MAG: tyrosine-type recombinase/integrase [Anaerolineae bacterium]|nr:tyrosine-type recombinase/integrase [Anaerolineae bacterium]
MRLGQAVKDLLLGKDAEVAAEQAMELDHLLRSFLLSQGVGAHSMRNVGLAQALDEYLLAKEVEGLSGRTLVKYRQQIEAFVTHVEGSNLADVTVHDVRLFLAELNNRKMTPSSRHTYYRSIHAFLSWTIREYGYPFPNPMDWIDPSKIPSRLPPVLSDEGFLALLSACDDGRHPLRDRAILILLLDTGIRAGELIRLKMSDLDLKEGELKCFGKDQEERIVPLEERAVRAIQGYLDFRPRQKAGDPLFPSERGPGCFLRESSLLHLIKRLATRAELEENVYTHLLRHTFAKKWLKGPGKGDMQALSHIMGHSSVKTTQIYAAYDADDIKEMHQTRSPANQILGQRTQQLSFWQDPAERRRESMQSA